MIKKTILRFLYLFQLIWTFDCHVVKLLFLLKQFIFNIDLNLRGKIFSNNLDNRLEKVSYLLKQTFFFPRHEYFETVFDASLTICISYLCTNSKFRLLACLLSGLHSTVFWKHFTCAILPSKSFYGCNFLCTLFCRSCSKITSSQCTRKVVSGHHFQFASK